MFPEQLSVLRIELVATSAGSFHWLIVPCQIPSSSLWVRFRPVGVPPVHMPLRLMPNATAPAATGRPIALDAVSAAVGHGPLDGCGPYAGGTTAVLSVPLLQ